MTNKQPSYLKKYLWIPITFLALSTICWAIVGYLFSEAFNSNGEQNNFLNNHDNLIFILARVFLAAGVVSLVFVLSGKKRILTTLVAVIIIVLGVVIFQIHENYIQRQALNGCLQAIGYDPEATHAYLKPTSTSIFAGEVKACYESNGIKETYRN